MDPKQKRLYLIAVYLIIVISAGTLLALGFDPESNSWQSVAFNLATELFAVALVFFLVDFLFSIEDWELSERVKSLVQILQNTRPAAESFFHSSPNFSDNIQNATYIDLCGVSLTSTLNKRFSTLRERLFEGANIRILIVAPKSPPLWMATWRSENTESIEYYKKRLDSTLNDIEYLYKNWNNFLETNENPGGNLAVRLMNYPPSFGILSFDRHKNDGTAFIELYPHHVDYESTPNFTVTKKRDTKWHRYFTNQFDAMWEAATDWRPGTNTSDVSSSGLLSQKPSATDVFIDRPNLEHYFENASEINLNGYSLERTVGTYRSVFLRGLKKGVHLRILLVDEETLENRFTGRTGTYYKQSLGLKVTLKNLERLLLHPENIGTIDIRFMATEPKFNLISVNPNNDKGVTLVEFGTMYWVEGECPRVLLTKDKDLYWFEFFNKQFEEAWENSSPAILGQHNSDDVNEIDDDD